jgi:ribosomal-protein-alanine acetyltransferase
VRPASRADLPELARLEQRAFSDPWSEAQLLEAFGWSGSLMLVTEAAGQITGYVLARSIVDEGEILSIAADPDLRRAGIGSALLAAATAVLEERGVRSLWLEVRTSNVAARSMYAAAGFVESGVRRNYYRDPVEDALVLQRVLGIA